MSLNWKREHARNYTVKLVHFCSIDKHFRKVIYLVSYFLNISTAFQTYFYCLWVRVTFLSFCISVLIDLCVLRILRFSCVFDYWSCKMISLWLVWKTCRWNKIPQPEAMVIHELNRNVFHVGGHVSTALQTAQ